MAISTLNSLKLGGFTSASDVASATITGRIAVVDVAHMGDGSWEFTINSIRYSYSGKDAAVNALLEKVFTGTGGFTAGATDNQFGNTGIA